MKALILEPHEPIRLIDIPGDGAEAELHAMQEAVGGWIETVHFTDDAVMIVDEEGVLKCRPRNDLASLVAGQMLVGTALIVGVDGDRFTDVPRRIVDALMCSGIREV